MTYLCHRCGAIIYEPRTVTSRENLDGENGVEWRTDLFCPGCGAEETYFGEFYSEETEDDAEDTD